ncbi:hypothetical protein UNDKW_3082 [Undibacterium sp. KW1]|uniref:DUF1801 domain-containing protein n=1 Tax=Undibacterium sp. KW1 TaxID=2058624 RepID=UPI001331E0AC|nr:DUF1801 domain-containing protein [Undibacterium sp. KW1]BBB61355.1 hypothetical protein UNDKW_3082 [Undibacterium sp. KW1]
MGKIKNPQVAKVFNNYPSHLRQKLMLLRQLVLDVASEHKISDTLEETLKWGEPSYLTKTGSTVRIDWKSSAPEQYAMYFHCQTRLLDTFKELYSDKLKFEGNRAIIFHQDDEIPIDEVKHCILLSLTYHDRKHLTMLGI